MEIQYTFFFLLILSVNCVLVTGNSYLLNSVTEKLPLKWIKPHPAKVTTRVHVNLSFVVLRATTFFACCKHTPTLVVLDQKKRLSANYGCNMKWKEVGRREDKGFFTLPRSGNLMVTLFSWDTAWTLAPLAPMTSR